MKDRLYPQQLVVQEQTLFSYVFVFLLFHAQIISHVSGYFCSPNLLKENWLLIGRTGKTNILKLFPVTVILDRHRFHTFFYFQIQINYYVTKK